jgi:probable HAF family extracellular repeat protein
MNFPKTALILAAGMAIAPLSAGTITDLGKFSDGSFSYGAGISADGTVAVGYGNTLSGQRAFRWTLSGGMTDIGLLSGGTWSEAFAASSDGSVIVGQADDSSAVTKAFRWTQAGGMTDLGILPGANFSHAYGVSADGSVVVGWSDPSGGRAFRWTQAGGMTDLGTLGGAHAVAKAVSADGSVVAGNSELITAAPRAFRWTQAGGMTNLGVLTGGGWSDALGISADGSVVVGASDSSVGTRAFRWTQAEGMTSIGTLPGGTWSEAHGVSADGSLIVGYSGSSNGARAFLYQHRVMLDVADWLGSVGGVSSLMSSSLELTRLHLEGAHHRPLADLGRVASFWTTGDIASSSRTRDLLTRSGEAGATFAPLANVLVGIGAGYGVQDQHLANDGSARTNGQYLVGEIDLVQADGGIFSLLGSFGDWRNSSDRGYVTGTGVDYSHGETTLASSTFRLRYDSPVLARVYATDLKAYVSYGHNKVRSDAYAETGGSYAASFGAMDQTAKEGRLGLAATHALNDKTKVRFSAEWIRRYDHDLAALTATDITSTLSLSLATPDPVRDQARFGVDVDYAFDAQTTLSFTVHAAGRGEAADVSGAVSLRRSF